MRYPMVMFLMFSLSLVRLYVPGAGFFVCAKMETDLQSSLPWPMEMPYLGLFWNSEASVYLSGEGDVLLLNERESTVRGRPCLRSRRKELFCRAWRAYRRKECCVKDGLPG